MAEEDVAEIEEDLETMGGSAEDGAESSLEAIYDVPVEISVILGTTSMTVSELLQIGSGTIIELERKVGEAVDVFINKRLVARGEIVIVEEFIGITMTEVIK